MTDAADVQSLARQWWDALSDTSYVPMTTDDGQEFLAALAQRLVFALDVDDFDADIGAEIGAALVSAQFTSPVVVRRSTVVLAELTELLSARPAREYRNRTTELLGAFGEGYAAALQQRTFTQQEAIVRAVVDARRQVEQQLQASEKRFRVIFDNAPAAIALGDRAGRILDANPTLCALLRLPVDRLRGIAVLDFLHPEDRPEIESLIYDQLVPGGAGTVRFERRFRTADGEWLWGSLAITYVSNNGAGSDYLLAVGEDITERRRMQSELHHQSRHDPLTGLPNRLRLHEELTAITAAAKAPDLVGLVLLDLDGFKQVNDQHGHAAGDSLLVTVADRLRGRAARAGRLLARLGGDEFVALIAPPVDDDGLAAAAQELITALAEPFTIGHHRVRVSACAGVTSAPAATADLESLIADADRELYRAKAIRPGSWSSTFTSAATKGKNSP